MKENEILKEQRRAREEFLKLKKMQSGEIKAEPKPSECEIIPQTPKEKFENIWYHYKWAIIGTVSLTLIFVLLFAQCITKDKYDLRIAIHTQNYISESAMDEFAAYFEQFCEDIDGDGKVTVQMVNCSYNKDTSNPSNNSVMYTKIQSLIAADETTMLYITDEVTYENLSNISEDVVFFDGSPTPLGDDFYKACDTDEMLPLPENLQISCRSLGDDVAIAKNENAEKYHKVSTDIIMKLQKRDIG